jgi:hypothetical protein
VDKEKQPLKGRIHFVKVRLYRLLLPLQLGFQAHGKHLISQPVVLKYPVKQPSVAALLKLVCVALVLKEVPALLLIAVAVLDAVEEDIQQFFIASFVRIEEKQAF